MGRGRAPCCDKTKVRTGPWSPAEDLRLITFIQKNGHDNWRALPKQAGLLRCGKSCRLRWINYLRPDVKRGNFTLDEENTIIRLHNTIGNKWSKIASCLPGRTDNEIKNVWNTHLKKRVLVNKKQGGGEEEEEIEKDPNPKAVLLDSPSPASSSNETTSDFDVDFWNVLDSLDPLQPSKTQNNVEGEEVEIGKWLRFLEDELGLTEDADAGGDHLHPDN